MNPAHKEERGVQTKYKIIEHEEGSEKEANAPTEAELKDINETEVGKHPQRDIPLPGYQGW